VTNSCVQPVGILRMRTIVIFCIGLLASFWVDAICYNGTYVRAADTAGRHLAKVIVTVIRKSV
jgi:hypothetical protein